MRPNPFDDPGHPYICRDVVHKQMYFDSIYRFIVRHPLEATVLPFIIGAILGNTYFG